MDKIVIEADQIFKTYSNGRRELEVLSGIGLNVNSGNIITIMGQSGAGKSTLLNILGTLDKPDKGVVKINNIRVDVLLEDELAELRNKHIGFIFQFHHLLPEFTAQENMLLPAWIKNGKKIPTDWGMELLETVGLTERKDHLPSQLSGGERLRTAVVRALINQPDILLADEPTGNLDIENARKLIDLLLRINRDFGQTIVLTTHNPEVAEIGHVKYELCAGQLRII
ncbi:MAG: lipoprotein-releasing system ATP-binding protein LolD [Candidatus Marinimicrobia bacterium]|nr:lipoprotein-releasing system ATP-binding protein LolD [Candidatus Neomarinimicrobiota bacterium]|tara:strand:+ start:2850 stop:3527 length:678 start_codon:yes stop_codon:yes gene_type:complete